MPEKVTSGPHNGSCAEWLQRTSASGATIHATNGGHDCFHGVSPQRSTILADGRTELGRPPGHQKLEQNRHIVPFTG